MHRPYSEKYLGMLKTLPGAVVPWAGRVGIRCEEADADAAQREGRIDMRSACRTGTRGLPWGEALSLCLGLLESDHVCHHLRALLWLVSLRIKDKALPWHTRPPLNLPPSLSCLHLTLTISAPAALASPLIL